MPEIYGNESAKVTDENEAKFVHNSPVFGLELRPDREKKRPEILTADEIRRIRRNCLHIKGGMVFYA